MKKIACFIIVVVLTLGTLGTAAMAKDKPKCDDIKAAAQMAKLEAMVVSANIQILAAVRKAQLTIKNDVDWLLRQVDKITARVFKYADSIGATVVCEYVRYYVDGQYVLVDPLHVVHV